MISDMKKTEQVAKLSTLSSTNSVVTETGEASERLEAAVTFQHVLGMHTAGRLEAPRTDGGRMQELKVRLARKGSSSFFFFFCKKTKNICSALLTSYLCCAAGAQILAELAGVVRHTTHLQAAENTSQLGGKKTTHNQTLVSHTTDSGGVGVRDVCECVCLGGGRLFNLGVVTHMQE